MLRSKNNKVQAFTILEVTISMLLAAIVIGITYTSYGIISRSFLSFKARNEDIAMFTRVDQLLKRDFEQASDIYTNNNRVIIKKNALSVMSYEITPSYIVRNANIIDTFKVNTLHYQMLFEGKIKETIDNNSATLDNDENDRIDELLFTISYKNENIPFHYHKLYSSINLIKRNVDAIN